MLIHDSHLRNHADMIKIGSVLYIDDKYFLLVEMCDDVYYYLWLDNGEYSYMQVGSWMYCHSRLLDT